MRLFGEVSFVDVDSGSAKEVVRVECCGRVRVDFVDVVYAVSVAEDVVDGTKTVCGPRWK